MSHPSRLALDRFALGCHDPDAAAHVETCEACAAHVQRVKVDLPLPSWVKQLEARPEPGSPGWVVGLALLAAAAGLLVVLARPGAPAAPSGITAKGAPEVAVWLKRGGTVTPWKGGAVRPGDAFEVEVAAGGFGELTVADASGATLTVVHRGKVSGHALSPAFTFDAAPGPEQVVILLSHAPLSDEAVREAVDGGGGAWTKRFTFPKEAR